MAWWTEGAPVVWPPGVGHALDCLPRSNGLWFLIFLIDEAWCKAIDVRDL